MKRIMCIALFAIISGYYICNAASVPNIYSDQRALRVDDILTIEINESATAADQSQTNTDKQNSYNLQAGGGSGLLKILPNFGASSSNQVAYTGAGSTSRQGSLTATISARVVKVLDNGNLQIEGSKLVEINEEKETIKISGIVRPQDILQNNIVPSCNIADAQITYSGKGVATTGQRPGFIARAFNWLF
jgi:flagellar L-ring protein precursor FlgH